MSAQIPDPAHQTDHAGAPRAETLVVRRQRASAATGGVWLRRITITLLIITGLLTFGYAGVSSYIATKLVYAPQVAVSDNPGRYGMTYSEITFPARGDGVRLNGWVIPGVLPSGRFTDDRIIVMVHGTRTNRADPAAGVLELSLWFARQGFAVLSFDMRGMGQSPPAPLSLGYFEQRDVLSAVDFIRSGPWPYPELGRPRVIGGWGVSMGAATLLLAAAQEPAIRAVVSDCAYADIVPILEREIPKQGGVPPLFTPGALLAAQAIYGMNFYAVRPVDVIARIAPRPILLIHGAADDYIPPANMGELYVAANTAPNAHVQQWLVPGAKHAQSYHTLGAAYVVRVIAFFNAALGPDQGGAD